MKIALKAVNNHQIPLASATYNGDWFNWLDCVQLFVEQVKDCPDAVTVSCEIKFIPAGEGDSSTDRVDTIKAVETALSMPKALFRKNTRSSNLDEDAKTEA